MEKVNYTEFNIDMIEPRKGFVEGYRPLAFEQTLSNGMKLAAWEESIGWQQVENRYHDEDCEIPYEWDKRIPQIKIFDQNGQSVFDFASLLPEDYTFVVPNSFDKGDVNRIKFRQSWLAESKHVLVSDWQRPEELFALLHEIGHTWVDTDPRAKRVSFEELVEYPKTGPGPFDYERRRKDFAASPETKAKALQGVKAVAFSERMASAWALKTIRRVSQEIGVDLIKEMGLDRKKLVMFIETALNSHRKYLELSFGKPLTDEDNIALDEVIKELNKDFKV